MTRSEDERREQLIDETVNRLIVGETIRFIDTNGASKSVNLGDLLIREVEDGNSGFKDFMQEVHFFMQASPDNVEELRTDQAMLSEQMNRIARPWVEDYIEEIERAVIDEAADEDARRRFEDREAM